MIEKQWQMIDEEKKRLDKEVEKQWQMIDEEKKRLEKQWQMIDVSDPILR